MTRARGEVALERALSKLGAASRTRARELVRAGRVRIDGRVVTDPLAPVVPERVRVEIDGRAIARAEWRTIAFHKPRHVVTTAHDPQGRRTVYDVLGEDAKGLIPVGRLDLATTGLLLLTTDTPLAAWLTDPSSAVPRTYVVTVRGRVGDDTVAAIEQGIDVEGESLSAVAVAVRKRSRRETHLVVTLDEGRNREIRRLFAARGHEVTRLKRVAFGSIELGELPPGGWRAIAQTEMRAAFPRAPIGTRSSARIRPLRT